MKKQVLFSLLCLGFCILGLSGFKKYDLHFTNQNFNVTKARQPVTITAVFSVMDGLHWTGTFTTSGALDVSGSAVMDIDPNQNGVRAHCVVELTAPDGTITIHQECEFKTKPPKGQWQIVGGTGAYANLKGNGSLTMPPATEAMEGYIY
jgi:hypothetical protein